MNTIVKILTFLENTKSKQNLQLFGIFINKEKLTRELELLLLQNPELRDLKLDKSKCPCHKHLTKTGCVRELTGRTCLCFKSNKL